MKAVLLNGSPRRKKNTHQLLAATADHLNEMGMETNIICAAEILRGLEVPFCTACRTPCDGSCFSDTEMETAMSEIRRADAVVAASPVYFGTVSAPLKAFWDLTLRERSRGSLLYTVGAAIAVGGGRFGGQETTLRAIHDMMLIHGMILVGDSSSAGTGHLGVAVQQGEADESHVKRRLRILAEAVFETARETRSLRQSHQ